MKKILVFALSLALCAGLLAGCGAGGTNKGDGLTGVVNTDGSTSMEKVVGALAESFMARNSGVTVNYSGTGSGSGITAAIDGTADIGLSSRELKDDETAKGATAHTVALDGVAVLVNPANGVEDLSVEEISKIFTGEVTNWSEVGGTDGPIAIIGREAGSGTRGAFEEIIGAKDKCKYTNELTSTGDVMANVASNPNAIGYASLSAVNDTVKALKVNGVAPSEETVLDGTYPIQRPFLLITKDGKALTPAAQAFMDYCMSSEAADIIAKAGAVAPKA